jgi:hypothetical protein
MLFFHPSLFLLLNQLKRFLRLRGPELELLLLKSKGMARLGFG